MTAPTVWTNHGDAIYVNADKSAVVSGDSPEAAFLLVAEGGTLPIEEAQKYDLIGSQLPERGRGRSKLGDVEDERAPEEEETDEQRKAKSAAPNKAKEQAPNKGR